MNISQPVASSIGSVDFGFLSSEEIKALSVKKIQNPTTFDTLLHPVPGGLYDAALGAWGDNPYSLLESKTRCLVLTLPTNSCSTCQLNTYTCPGHVGHIELPVPVYHVTFMDQMLRLLRGTCAYCNRLKMARIEVNRFCCRLRLVRYGLLKEAEELDELQLRQKIPKGSQVNGGGVSDDDDSDISEGEDTDKLIQRRGAFVKQAIKRSKGSRKSSTSVDEKIGAIAEERREIVKELLAAITKVKTCGSCHGVSPSYRKDRYSKIFRKALSKRDRAKMVQGGFKMTNPLIRATKERKAEQMRKRDDREADEGIVADLDDVTPEEDDEDEDIEMLDAGREDAGNGLVQAEAAQSEAKRKSSDEDTQHYVNAREVHASLTELFEKEKEIMELVYNSRTRPKSAPSVTADMFFITDVVVPPNRYRPEAKTGDGEIAEAQQNSLYKQILTHCEQLNQIRKDMSNSTPSSSGRRRDFNDLQNVWVRLQDAVNALIDRDRNPVQGAAGKQNEDGIKQLLEKKDGLFRKNMMGKRVNFAARSVISPDPNIETNEIGVPPVFAKKLTYPEPVTNHNFYELKEAVLNGVDKWPGAAAIENENGQVISLRTKNFEERQALANQLLAPSNTNVTGARNKKVYRHLNNGDIVIMNRQPTLHKPSMMGHRARVLPGEKTIRMHYANCNTYNADFDGDEMNMHFPQNEIARAEALQIADTDHQYLVATSGKPLRGLIQDHLSMGVWLTNRDTLFDREDYHQLLYSCLRPEDSQTSSDRILTVTPAIIKPKSMWTGKQVITSVLKNLKPDGHPGLTLTGKSQTAASRWGENSEEGVVMFQDGELLCGILDKAQLGPSNGGFVHSVYEAYGHTIAGRLLGVLGRLLTKFLHMRAFTCGMDDLLLTKKGDEDRREKLKDVNSIGLEVAAKYVTLDDTNLGSNTSELQSRLEDVMRDDEKQAGLDAVVNSRTSILSSEITAACLPAGLVKPFPKNQMQAMTTSGAKGSSVNANLISCNLGQQVLEGRRVPTMVSGKTLPCFKPFETNIRAGGYITDRFLTGIKPQEYYFHAMAGREGLIDTAVKTSRSGYLQRCLIKGMEGLKVEYDTSVRDSDGSMVQFLYGEDGLDVTKQKHLTDFKFLAENFLSLFAQLNVREQFSKIVNEEVSEWQKEARRIARKTGVIDGIDPVLAHFNPGSKLGSTSQAFATALKAYCEVNPERLLRDKKREIYEGITKRSFTALLEMKYMKSVVDPGEAVGIVAGQSVGEPSTQMTLNTFHLAGHSAKNVTLGIPRLREIVMTASNHITTPMMTLHLIPELTEEEGRRFAKAISKLTLAEIIDTVSVSERIGKGVGYATAKSYNIRLAFFPSDEYQAQYAIEVQDVLHTLEYKFIPRLARIIKKELTSKGDAKLLKTSAAQPEVGRSSGTIEQAPSRPEGEFEGGDDDEDDDGDDDATNNKQRQNRAAAISYDAPDDEEEAIADQARRESTPDADMEDEGFVGSPRAFQVEGDSQPQEQNGSSSKDSPTVAAKEREDRIMTKVPALTRFAFDDKNGQWCEIRLEYDVNTAKLLMLNLVEDACGFAVIQAIPGLKTCMLSEEKTRNPITGEETISPVVITEGVNLTAMHDYQNALNPHKIFTNDIAAMLRLYGVEACRANIILEMDSVFKGHGITVDNRHLNLIADMMTKGGGFSPFSRNGLKGSVSPFMKMSFETTVGFLRDALLDGDWDDLKGPSGRIVVGKASTVGTGAFDVLMPVA